MKVIINGAQQPRKEYSNLPERDPNDLVRQRLGERRGSEARLGDPASREDRMSMQRQASIPRQASERAEAGSEALRSELGDSTADTTERDVIAEYLSDGDDDATREDAVSWRHSRWAPLAFVGALLVLIGILYVASHADHSLALERVTVRGATLLSEREVLELASVDRTAKFYDIDLKQLQKRLLGHSLIKAAHPRRELNPATIVLDIEERQPIAMLRSSATGEAFIIDRDGMLLQPKLISGLRDPARLMQVPLLSGVSERDTVGYQAMARLVAMISTLDSGALKSAIGELRRTPTGASR